MTRIRKAPGRIAFVGAGPGDPGLLTRRAYDALVEADQVVNDRGVPDSLLDAVRADVGIEHGVVADLFVAPASHEIIGLNATIPSEVVAWLRAQPGVSGVDTFRETSVPIRLSEGDQPILLAVVDGVYRHNLRFEGGDDVEKMHRVFAGEAVAVTESFSRKHRVTTGDTLTFLTPQGPASLPIAGVYSGPLMLEGIVGEELGRIDATRRQLDPLLREILQERATPCDGEPPPGLLEGIQLFNDGDYYECHEAIEHEWHAETGPIRRLYQGILQIGVGFLHARRGNHTGALLLLADGIAKTAEFAPRCLGIDTGRLAVESEAALETLRELGPERLREFDFAAAPRVHLVDEPAPASSSAARGDP